MKRNCILCLALCAGGLSGSVFAGPCYDVEVLWGQSCGIFGPAGVFPADISADGTVVGAVEQCEHPEFDEGFVWPVEDDLFIIPRPTGVAYLYAACTNDTGLVGVFMSGTGLGGGHVYDMVSGTFTPIGVPPGGNYIKPHAINNLAHTCGEWGNNQTGDPELHAFVVTDRGLFDLGSLLIGPHSIARDINDHSSVVGWTGNALSSASSRGFIYRDGVVTDFGVAPDCYNSSARAVNAHDEVACTASEPILGGVIGHAFIWKDGNWTQLAHLPGYEDMNAHDINDHGMVVGGAFSPGETDYVWIDGVTYDLNQRIPADSGVYIESAVAINNAGQIACGGTTQHPFFGPSTVGVRLTPRPPQPADLTDDCAVNGEDLMILLQSWGPVKGSKRNANLLPGAGAADLDGNGIVNGFDLAILLGAWG